MTHCVTIEHAGEFHRVVNAEDVREIAETGRFPAAAGNDQLRVGRIRMHPAECSNQEIDATARDKVAGRKVNNASILMQRRYGRYDEFREKFEKAEGRWRVFF